MTLTVKRPAIVVGALLLTLVALGGCEAPPPVAYWPD